MTVARAWGRHVEHDPRNWDYTYPEPGPGRRLATVVWPRYSPILDQGELGSCTGNALVGLLGCAPFSANVTDVARFDEVLAVRVYADATHLDNVPGAWPPEDTGSTGNAVAKAAKRRGLIAGYSWCRTSTSLLHALQHGPVIVGSVWTERMSTPDRNGEVHADGPVLGGHEYLVRGVEFRAGADALLHCDNSWGPDWGLAGSFTMSLATWARLRAQQADVTVPHPVGRSVRIVQG